MEFQSGKVFAAYQIVIFVIVYVLIHPTQARQKIHMTVTESKMKCELSLYRTSPSVLETERINFYMDIKYIMNYYCNF